MIIRRKKKGNRFCFCMVLELIELENNDGDDLLIKYSESEKNQFQLMTTDIKQTK